MSALGHLREYLSATTVHCAAYLVQGGLPAPWRAAWAAQLATFFVLTGWMVYSSIRDGSRCVE